LRGSKQTFESSKPRKIYAKKITPIFAAQLKPTGELMGDRLEMRAGPSFP
jgi:hypothetical protein